MNQQKYDMWNTMWNKVEHPDKNNMYHNYRGFGHFYDATALSDDDCIFALMMKYANAKYYSGGNLKGALLGREKVCQQMFGSINFRKHATAVIKALNECCTRKYGLQNNFLDKLSSELGENLRGKDINENGDLFALLTVIREKTNNADLFPFIQGDNTATLAQAYYA
jgi:hypothetical protein